MDLGPGTLAKINSKVLSELGHDEAHRMVRVSISDAV